MQSLKYKQMEKKQPKMKIELRTPSNWTWYMALVMVILDEEICCCFFYIKYSVNIEEPKSLVH